MPSPSDRIGIVVERITAEGIWTAATAVHTGGDGDFDSSVDMPVARDMDGRFYLPGSSLAGVARSYLARFRQNFPAFRTGDEPEELRQLFGGSLRTAPNKAAYASLLIWSEGRHLPPDSGKAGLSVRDGVRIEGATGQAASKGKYNLEVLPAGTRFQIRVELLIYDVMPEDISREQAREQLRWILESFQANGVRLGARTRKGLGRGGVTRWTIREFDLRTPSGALDWLAGDGFSGGNVLALDQLGRPVDGVVDRFAIHAEFIVPTSLLVRSGSSELNGPDTVHFQENGVAWLPGSSLAGAFRQRVERVANTLGLDGKACGIELFGIANDPDHNERASRVWFEESLLAVPKDRGVQSRVAIDRFAGGALEARLFDSAPYWGPAGASKHLEISIAVDDPSPQERQLLLAAFQDLWLGDLPVGGEAGGGRGTLHGLTARITQGGLGLPEMTWQRDPQRPEATQMANADKWRPLVAEAGA